LTYRETDYGKNIYNVTTGYKELIQSNQSYKVSFRWASETLMYMWDKHLFQQLFTLFKQTGGCPK